MIAYANSFNIFIRVKIRNNELSIVDLNVYVKNKNRIYNLFTHIFLRNILPESFPSLDPDHTSMTALMLNDQSFV